MASRRLRPRRDLIADVLEDVGLGLRRHAGRATLFAVGAALAVGLFSYSATYSSTTASQITGTFDALSATRLRVDLPLSSPTFSGLRPSQIEALESLAGVDGVAVVGRTESRITAVTHAALDLESEASWYGLAGDPAVLGLEGEITDDRYGVYVGGGLAGETGLKANARVERDGVRSSVTGVLATSRIIPDLLFGVVETVDLDAVTEIEDGVVVVEVRPGWADNVAPAVAQILNPNHPRSVLVKYPPEASQLRAAVVTQVDGLVVVVAISVLVLSGVAVGVATFAHVLQNFRLIGLRRAIGSTRMMVGVGVLTEVTLTALVGAVAGGLLGTASAAVVSASSGTAPTVPFPLLVAGGAVAVVMNALAALPPAIRAMRIQPVQALASR